MSLVPFASLILVFWSTTVPDDLDLLSDRAGSEDKYERIDALLRVGKLIPDLQDEQQLESAYHLLIDAVADPADLVNTAARMRLAELRSDAVQYLKPYVQSDDMREFAKACEAIKSIGPEARIWLPDIQKKLGRDERNFKLAALHALGALDGKDLLPVLDSTIACLDSKDFNIQLSACRVLSKLGPDAKKAGPRLVRLQAEGIASARSWASIALGAIGPHEEYDVLQLLVDRLDQFYLVDRERALIGLAELGSNATDALPQIEALMADRSKSVQHTAARTYWKISGDPVPAVKCLIDLIPTMEFGTAAMDVIAEMGPASKAAVPALIQQLKSPEAANREAAIYALAAIGPDAAAALEPLQKSRRDKDRLISAAAALAIEKISVSK